MCNDSRRLPPDKMSLMVTAMPQATSLMVATKSHPLIRNPCSRKCSSLTGMPSSTVREVTLTSAQRPGSLQATPQRIFVTLGSIMANLRLNSRLSIGLRILIGIAWLPVLLSGATARNLKNGPIILLRNMNAGSRLVISYVCRD